MRPSTREVGAMLRRIVAVSAMAAFIFVTSGAALPEKIDIRLKSGEAIENATYVVDQRFKVLRLTLDGGKTRSVSFTEVAGITADGVDVTTPVLGPGYGGGPVGAGEWLSEDEEAYRKARTPIWKSALRAAANYSVPVGEYYEGVKSGVGFEGDLMIPVNHEAGIYLSVSKSGMKWDENEFRVVPLDPDFVILTQEFGIDAWRYSVGGVIYKHLDRQRVDRSMLYAYGGVGIVQHKLTGDLSVRRISDGSTASVSADDTQTKFMTPFGGGLIKTITPGFGVDLSGNVDPVWTGSSSLGWILDLRGGLVVFF